MRYLKSEVGMTLLEVVIAMVILAVAVVPMLNLFDLGTRYYKTAGEETLEVNLARSIMEELLAKSYEAVTGTNGLVSYPSDENYQYQIIVTDEDPSKFLKKVIVELYSKTETEPIVELSTLVAKR